MKHKDYLKKLKEDDPITYYEMTSNPTGVNSESNVEGCLIILFIIFVALFCAIVMIYLKYN